MKSPHWLAAFFSILAVMGFAPAPSHLPAIAPPHVIRFRVIANSDNPRDQAIKLDVRDRVLETLDPVLNGVKSRQAASARIERLEPRLDAVANRVLAAHHAAYRARVSWVKTVFPTKAYGSWVLPAGRYQALLITLGQGQGHNWWCVLYPSLCFVDMGNALAVKTRTALPTAAHPFIPAGLHRRSRPHSGRIRVSWTTPRFITIFLAILR